MAISDDPKLHACAAWLLKLDRSELEGEMSSGLHVQEKSGKSQDQLQHFLVEQYHKEIAEHVAFNESFGSNFPANIP